MNIWQIIKDFSKKRQDIKARENKAIIKTQDILARYDLVLKSMSINYPSDKWLSLLSYKNNAKELKNILSDLYGMLPDYSNQNRPKIQKFKTESEKVIHKIIERYTSTNGEFKIFKPFVKILHSLYDEIQKEVNKISAQK